MKCRLCASGNTRVTCTDQGNHQTKRYKRCLDCDHRFVTVETYMLPPTNPDIRARRVRRGEASGLSVLTEANVLDIRRLAIHNTYEQIAKQFGIHKSTVYRIVNLKLWSHI